MIAKKIITWVRAERELDSIMRSYRAQVRAALSKSGGRQAFCYAMFLRILREEWKTARDDIRQALWSQREDRGKYGPIRTRNTRKP